MERRYVDAYPGVFDGVEASAVRRLLLILGSTADGGLWPRRDVEELIERLSGDISFEEYRHRGRRARCFALPS